MAAKGRRRSHGEGSVFRRASDGRWVASLSVAGSQGRRVRKTVYGRSEREVLEKLRDLRRAADQGRDLTRSSPTLSVWLDEWLRIKAADGIRPSTMRFYRQLIENHIRPELGTVRLDKLTPGDVRGFVSDRSESNLALATVAHLLRLLRNALGEAERLDLVTRNVAKAVRMPQVESYHPHTLTIEEARALLDVVRDHRLQALFSMALVLGLRRGELLGLAWSDIDFEQATVHVRHSLQRVDGALRLVEPKTRASSGLVVAPSGLLDILSRHRARQGAERLALGTAWPGTSLVFTSTTGTPIEPRNLSREWDKVRRAAGVPEMRLHDLRHSCATILTAIGVHPRVIMQMLRHSDIGISMNVYAHVSTSLQREAADALDAALFV